MIRLAVVLLAVACLTTFSLPVAAQAEQLNVTDTNDSYLNLRTGPGTGYAIFQRRYAGQGIQFTGSQDNWRRVVLADGTVRWASANYLR